MESLLKMGKVMPLLSKQSVVILLLIIMHMATKRWPAGIEHMEEVLTAVFALAELFVAVYCGGDHVDGLGHTAAVALRWQDAAALGWVGRHVARLPTVLGGALAEHI
jgi:predicted anti-sigma-YlaC factor YlaD